jgi:hypothetical protein
MSKQRKTIAPTTTASLQQQHHLNCNIGLRGVS